VAPVEFLSKLIAGQHHFVGIDDHDVISGIDVGRKDRFVFPTQQDRHLHRESSQRLAFRVN
jgi:hypothetical protein